MSGRKHFFSHLDRYGHLGFQVKRVSRHWESSPNTKEWGLLWEF